MAVRLLPNFKTLSEFGAYHGDCGELATLAALHSIDPAGWPLTLVFLDRMVADELRAGLADPGLSGGQNIPAIDTYLARRGIAHTTVGYAQFTLDAFHADLKANAGVRPVIVEWANAGALPGDERGVRYHYSTCGGIDTGPAGDGVGGAYLWADGDNAASTKADGGSAPVRYTWQQVVAAQPIGYIVITQQQAPTSGQSGASGMWHEQADGTGRDDAGHSCGAGFMAEIKARGIAADGRESESYVGGAERFGWKSMLPLTDGDVLVWTGSAVTHDGALVAYTLHELLNEARSQQQAQPPAPPQPPAPAPIPEEYARAKAAIDALKLAAGL